jgi:hypothetical protein
MPEAWDKCAFFVTKRAEVWVVGVGQIWRKEQFFGDLRELLSRDVPEISERAAEMMGYFP